MKPALRSVVRIAAALSTLVAHASLSAQLVTSVGALNGQTTTLISFGPGGTNVASGYTTVLGGIPNVTLTYTGSGGLFFDYCGWGLGANGTTCVTPSAGVNQAGLLQFTFGNGLVQGAGVTLNYAPDNGPVILRALDASRNLLAEYELNMDAPITTNAFQFRGIQFTGNSIGSFELEGQGSSSPIIQSFTFTTAPTIVPEPSTIALVAVGFVAIAGAARRRAR